MVSTYSRLVFVSVEDCVIDGFIKNGINVAAGGVFVRNTTIRNNGAAGMPLHQGRWDSLMLR